MNAEEKVAILNGLLLAEGTSLLHHARRTAWAGPTMRELARFVQEAAARSLAAVDWLSDHIYDLGGVPTPVPTPIHQAELHYLSYEYLRPFIREDFRRRLSAYAKALSDDPGDDLADRLRPRADELADELALFEELIEQGAAGQPAT